VHRDVAAYELVGGVPARHLRWVGRAGRPLEPAGEPGRWRCPVDGVDYVEEDGQLWPAP
jgi:UDP-2-acetamido-3-amino-2,3-dideoxy-glucuronate N-acetyltransferase